MKNLYVMSRICDYERFYYEDAIVYLFHHYPDWNVIPAKGLWADNAAWILGWPEFVPTLDAGVILTGETGAVGPGVVTEAFDLLMRGKPVTWIALVYNDDGSWTFTEPSDMDIRFGSLRNPREFAFMRASDPALEYELFAAMRQELEAIEEEAEGIIRPV